MTPKENPLPIKQSISIPSSPAPGNRQFVLCLMDLLILDISYKWNYLICGLLFQASFTQCNVFEFIHIAAWTSTSFLAGAEQYPPVWIYHLD